MNFAEHSIVHPGARIDQDVIIEPFVIIEQDVQIGKGTTIASHAVIKNGTRIGKHCNIHEGAIIGGDPQDQKYKGEPTLLLIDDHVTIREYCTINRGTRAKGETLVKRGALIMAYCHVAHDCLIKEGAVLSNNVQLAGHVTIGERAIIGGMTAVQQFLHIGDHTFIGGGTLVRKDVPPYIRVAREPLSYVGVNTIGLRRRGFSDKDIHLIQEIYRILFVKNHNLSQGLDQLREVIDPHPIKEEIISFVVGSEKGIIRGFKQTSIDEN